MQITRTLVVVFAATLLSTPALAQQTQATKPVNKPAAAPVRAAKPTAAKAPSAEAPKVEPKRFTNADVLMLSAGGFDDQIIVGAINKAREDKTAAFDLEASSIVDLKNNKVSQRVIAAMLGIPYVEPAAAPAPVPAPTVAAVPAPVAEPVVEIKTEKSGGIKGLFKKAGSAVGIKTKEEADGAKTAPASASGSLKVKDGQAAVIRTQLPPDAALAKVVEYLNSKDRLFHAKLEGAVITTDWAMNRGCGPGFNKCENKVRVDAAKQGSDTVVTLEVIRRKREAGINSKPWNEDNKIHGDDTSKMAVEIDAALAGSTVNSTK